MKGLRVRCMLTKEQLEVIEQIEAELEVMKKEKKKNNLINHPYGDDLI